MTLRTSRSDSSVRCGDLVDGLVRQRADLVLDVEQHRNQDRALGRIVRDHGGEALFELVGEFHEAAISIQQLAFSKSMRRQEPWLSAKC